MDTVFVVAGSCPYRGGMARETIGDGAPEHAHLIALDLVRPGEYTLYAGAAYDSPVDGRFSFFPAVPAAERPHGFARPPAPPSLQSQQAMGIKRLDNPSGYWRDAVSSVLEAGLYLGVGASLPE